MNWLRTLFNSSIGKKQVMAITGLSLTLFLLVHMLGNLLIYVSSDAFNMYSYTLTSNPLIYVAEAGLIALFVSHIGLAIKLTLENKQARPVGYYMKHKTGRGTTFASQTMPYTGMIGAIFVIIHIINFKLATITGQGIEMVTVDGIEMINLYKLVIAHFQDPVAIFIYFVGVAAFGIHLSHGFGSAFQTLGLRHPKYTPIIEKTSLALSILITVGFWSVPIWAYITGGHA